MFHVLGRGAVMGDGGAIPRNIAGKGATAENVLQNFPDAESQSVRLGHTLDLRFAKARTQNGGELTVTVNAGIVHLDNDDAFEFRPDFFEAIGQWMNVAEMERADFFIHFGA